MNDIPNINDRFGNPSGFIRSGSDDVERIDRKGGQEKRGRIFVVSAPSGAGKSTLCSTLLARFPNLSYSVSHTTRPPRKGERDGVDYHFISTEGFKKRIDENQWVEWAEVHGNYYGTSRVVIEKGVTEGAHLLLDIDVQGAEQVKTIFPEAITLFIMPPSVEVLEARLRSRGTDDEAIIEKRLNNAEKEMACKDLYEHVIVNDVLEVAEKELIDIVSGYLQS